MAAGRVAERFGEEGLHRLDDPRIGESRSVVVHIDQSMQHGTKRPQVSGRLLDGTQRDRAGFRVT